MKSCMKKPKTQSEPIVLEEIQLFQSENQVPAAIKLSAPVERQIIAQNQKYSTLSDKDLIEKLRTQKISLQRENIQQSRQIEKLERALQSQGNFFIKRTENTRRQNVELQRSVNVLQQSVLTNTLISASRLDANSQFASSQIQKSRPNSGKKMSLYSEINCENSISDEQDNRKSLRLLELANPEQEISPARPYNILAKQMDTLPEPEPSPLALENILVVKQQAKQDIIDNQPVKEIQLTSIFDNEITDNQLYTKICIQSKHQPIATQQIQVNENENQVLSNSIILSSEEVQKIIVSKSGSVQQFKLPEIQIVDEPQIEKIHTPKPIQFEINDSTPQSPIIKQLSSQDINQEISVIAKSRDLKNIFQPSDDNLYKAELEKEKNYGSFTQAAELPTITTPTKLGKIEPRIQ